MKATSPALAGKVALVTGAASGIKPISGNAAYGTSKAAIRFFTRTAALEGAPQINRPVQRLDGLVFLLF